MSQDNKRSLYVRFDKASNNYKINTEFREEEGKKKLILRGYPILFNVKTKVWDWWYGEVEEVILPTALDGTNLEEVYLLGGHNTDPSHAMGLTGINMRVEVDDIGLFYECELPNTQYARDIYNLVEVGIIDGMSFGFRSSDEINPSTKCRTITHIDELFEITITPFPAYKEASVIAMRNKKIEDDKLAKQQLEQKEAEEKRQKDLVEQAQKQKEAEEKRQKALAEQERAKKIKELEDL